MKSLAIPLVTLLACCGAQSIAHDYEGGITAEPAVFTTILLMF